MWYNIGMPSRPLPIHEARKRLSSLVERVAKGGSPVAIGRYGRERALIVGADQYARLTKERPRRSKGIVSIEGTLTLSCTPADLIVESRHLGDLWLEGLDGPADAKRRQHRRHR